MPRPRNRFQLGLFVPTCEVVSGVFSRIQDAPVAGQGRAGTAARELARTRRRSCHTASWRTSPPLRAARSLNGDTGSGIPIPRTAMPIHAVRRNNAPLFANCFVDFSCFTFVPGEASVRILICIVLCRRPPATDGICGRHTHWGRSTCGNMSAPHRGSLRLPNSSAATFSSCWPSSAGVTRGVPSARRAKSFTPREFGLGAFAVAA